MEEHEGEEDLIGDSEEDQNATSDEFNRFLEKRVVEAIRKNLHKQTDKVICWQR